MSERRSDDDVDHWTVYTEPQGRYRLRHPPDWAVRAGDNETVSIESPTNEAGLTVRLSPIDCRATSAALKERRLNYYFVRERSASVSDQTALTLEFRDTITNEQDYRTLVPSKGGCYELAWRQSTAEGDPRAVFASIVKTFEILP
jgi:hypothetical protein